MNFKEYYRAVYSFISLYDKKFGEPPKRVLLDAEIYNKFWSTMLLYQRLNKASSLFQLVAIKLVLKEDDSVSFLQNAELCPICGKHYLSYLISTSDMNMSVNFCTCGIMFSVEKTNIEQAHVGVLRTSVPKVFQDAFKDGELEV